MFYSLVVDRLIGSGLNSMADFRYGVPGVLTSYLT